MMSFINKIFADQVCVIVCLEERSIGPMVQIIVETCKIIKNFEVALFVLVEV